jgi:hypothetical protein
MIILFSLNNNPWPSTHMFQGLCQVTAYDT